MKNHLKLGAILFLFIVLQSCSEEDLQQSSTRFTFTDADIADPVLHLPGNSMLYVSIETAQGIPVLTDHAIKVSEVNGEYISEGLDLLSGEYILTRFSVNQGEDILYLIPEKESDPEKIIKQSLPLHFTVRANESLQLNMEVLKASKAQKANKLQIAAYDGQSMFTAATAFLLLGDDTLKTYSLQPKWNKFSFDLDPSVAYTLVIVRGGFAKHEQEFIYNDLFKKSLTAYLIPAFTMLAYTNPEISGAIFEFRLSSIPGTINIDWGNGTSETHTFTAAEPEVGFSKDYLAEGNHFISVTGDIDRITYFYAFYGFGMTDEINFEQLVGLTAVRIGLTRGPAIIDLSSNINLDNVFLPGIDELHQLILPTVNHINFVLIDGHNSMTTATVDAVINNIYSNAVSLSTMNGIFSVNGLWYEAEGEPLFTGPPSAAALDKLVILRDVYGWSVSPEF